MDLFNSNPQPVRSSRQQRFVLSASVVLHGLGFAMLLHSRLPSIVPARLPGTQHGSHLLLTYAPGRAPAEQNANVPARQVAAAKPLPLKQKVAAPVEASAALHTPTPAMQPADTTPGNDALGTGDINIALLSVFPTPKPDLSQLPHGTRGDVVLDVVIDETGRIAQLTMARGIGHGVDESVIATVRQWAFHPATRNGKPVASEQELLFHFEKS